MLVLMLAAGTTSPLSSKALVGDFFFIKYCLLSSSLVYLLIFGESMGEFFKELSVDELFELLLSEFC